MAGHGRANFFVLVYPIHWTKIFCETDHQGLSSSGVTVIDYQAEWFHKSPFEFIAVAVGLWLRQQAATTGVINSEREQRYLRNAFSVGGSNGSVWSFPFCFNRISTFPSASSSCFRQVAESCMPSSNSVRDLSSGTSPFSSSRTIFSNRSRHSSNFTNPFAPTYIVMPFRGRNVQQNLAKFVISWALPFPKGNSFVTVAKLSDSSSKIKLRSRGLSRAPPKHPLRKCSGSEER
jgi:hypothetical protein